jgi:hypothetical protein
VRERRAEWRARGGARERAEWRARGSRGGSCCRAAPDRAFGGRARGEQGRLLRTHRTGRRTLRSGGHRCSALRWHPPLPRTTPLTPFSLHSLHQRYGRSTSGTPPSLAPAPPLSTHEPRGYEVSRGAAAPNAAGLRVVPAPPLSTHEPRGYEVSRGAAVPSAAGLRSPLLPLSAPDDLANEFWTSDDVRAWGRGLSAGPARGGCR